jgi:hydrogenase expression/formation protein HypD
MGKVFVKSDIAWRGVGVIPGSGLSIAPGYESFDAKIRFGVETGTRDVGPLPVRRGPEGDRDVRDCPLFGNACTPDEPVGPCMVSSEGTCAAYFRFGVE